MEVQHYGGANGYTICQEHWVEEGHRKTFAVATFIVQVSLSLCFYFLSVLVFFRL